MYRRTTRGNRIGLILVGLVLLVLGAIITAMNRNMLGTNVSGGKIYPEQVSSWIADHRWSLWLLVAAAGAVGLLALRWIFLQFRTDVVRRLRLDTESLAAQTKGRTAITTQAVCTAVSDEAEEITGVRAATGRISGSPDDPEMWLTVTVDADADTGAVRSQLLGTVIANARLALDRPAMDCYLMLKVSGRSGGHHLLNQRSNRGAASVS